MNTELLEKVKRVILEEPRRYDQGIWMGEAVGLIEDAAKRPPCGTVACIAGWAVLIDEVEQTGKQVHEAAEALLWDVEDKAVTLLGLEPEQADRLFDVPLAFCHNDWPEQFANAYLAARTPQERARVAAERIDWFIKTNGEE